MWCVANIENTSTGQWKDLEFTCLFVGLNYYKSFIPLKVISDIVLLF